MSISKPVVLIVEDEMLVRFLAVTEFEDAGFAVAEAGSAGEAMAIMESGQRVELLFTDIRMPGEIDGWDLARRARALHPELPVIYATGFDRETGEPVTGGHLVQKPYRFSEILPILKTLGFATNGL